MCGVWAEAIAAWWWNAFANERRQHFPLARPPHSVRAGPCCLPGESARSREPEFSSPLPFHFRVADLRSIRLYFDESRRRRALDPQCLGHRAPDGQRLQFTAARNSLSGERVEGNLEAFCENLCSQPGRDWLLLHLVLSAIGRDPRRERS